jgi:hypothetical protein
MSRTSIALLLAAALSACSGQDTPRRCASPSDCPAESRCRGAVCVANASPVAQVSVPPGPVEFALVSLSGATSFDPDPEDGIASYRWTIRSAGAACAPPAVAGTDASAAVRFGCPGAYEIELVVKDGLGRESEPALAAVDVDPDPGPPLVTAGSDVFVGHSCAGAPLLCRPEVAGGSIALSSTGPGGAGITYAWTVEPPSGKPLGPGRRAVFSPGPDVPDPEVAIEADGLGISGDWVFRVEARDAAGAVGAAVMRVSIGNRPPEIAGSPGPVPHHHDPVAQAFHATGGIALAVTDPDGDPVSSRTVTAHHVGDGPGATFSAVDVGDAITFSITVPYSGPEAPAWLIGGDGLERSVRLAAVDVNGAEASAVWDVVVENRPPELAAPLAPVAVDHAYSPGAGAYLASAALSSWLDPDGDPLAVVPAQTVGPCAPPTLSSGTATVSCALPFTGSPAADQLAGTRPVPHAVRDPWASSATAAVTLTILNRPPAFLATAFTAMAACRLESGCCELDPDTKLCVSRELSWGPGAASSGTLLADPDGDPLSVVFGPSELAITPGSAVCTPSDCAFTFRPPQVTACGLEGTAADALVTDGAATVQATLDVSRGCQ